MSTDKNAKLSSGQDNTPKAPSLTSEQDNNKPTASSALLSKMKKKKEARKEETMSLSAWMELCKTDETAYEDVSARLLRALGAPEIIDTSKEDQQTRAVYGGRKIARYAPFKDLYDSEGVISQIATFIKNGSKGILVLRGPVGSGKTEIATILEELAEKTPMYLLKCKVSGAISPFNDSPLCLLSDPEIADDVSNELNIPKHLLKTAKSAWVTKRLKHHDNDFEAAFEVVKVYPSREQQLGVAKLDPKDPKSADMNSLVGSVDMTMLGEYDPLDSSKLLAAGDPDAYKPGAFSQSNGGVFHAAEFFRNNPALLNSFLEGVTTGYFTGDGGVGVLPMSQLIVVTSNDPVWKKFKAEQDSDAARNRIEVIDVPYTLRMSEELKIYDKLLNSSSYADKAVAPGTKELLAEFAVVTREMDGKDNSLAAYDRFVRAKVHNGEIPDGVESKIPKPYELREKAHPDQGLYGFSIRDAERVLKNTFNLRSNEGIIEADTILLIEELREFIEHANIEDISEEEKQRYQGYVDTLADRNRKELTELVTEAILDADDSTCQRMFDEYMDYAEAWYENNDLFTESGEPISEAQIVKYLAAFEKRAGITNGDKFRQNALASVNSEYKRIARANDGKEAKDQIQAKVHWTSYEPIAKAIRAQNEIDQESRRHIVKAKSESDLRNEDEKRQFNSFHKNMEAKGFSKTMVARILHHLGPSM